MIPVFRPAYGQEEFQAVRQVLKSGWVGLGPKTQQFEEAFAHYLGVKYAIGTNSCTAALHLALKVLDLPAGSEVITPSMTFISTNHAILLNNLVPVFCDIEEETLNIDATKIEPLITKKTKAIMCVHYGGHACDMGALQRIARKHNLYLIEDCAHAAGGEYKGEKLGSFGDLSCFSFHAVKNLATGQGGMIVTNNKKFRDRLLKLRWMGISKDTWNRSEIKNRYSWYYTVDDVGYLYYMFDIVAALGLIQLKKLDRLNAKRRATARQYTSFLKKLPGIEPPIVKPYAKSSQHNYVIKTQRRDDLIQFLSEQGIATSVHYFPNHLYEMYKPYYRKLPVTEKVWKKIVTLPLFPDLTKKNIRKILKAIESWHAQRLLK